jgi:DNA-binding transcriptional LysR family regulator
MLEKLSIVPMRPMRLVRHYPLKTRQLALLVHLDDERCLARAADTTGLTQPAASKLLRQIENTIGVKLFQRHSRGMAPTAYGEILVRHARTALAELGLAREEIAALRSGQSRKAAVGVVLDPKSNLVPMAVARMKQRHPDVLVSVESDSSRELIHKLLRGGLDIVVGRMHDSTCTQDLVSEALAADEPHAVFAGPQHPLAGRKTLQLANLLDQPWILPPAGSLLRDKLSALFLQQGLPLPSNIVETLAVPVIVSLLQQSNLVAALPEEAVQSTCKQGTLTMLIRNLPLAVGAFGLITRRSHQLSPGAQLMLKTLREIAAESPAAVTGSQPDERAPTSAGCQLSCLKPIDASSSAA